WRVAVFERRRLVGGAVSSEEVVPGYTFDWGGSAHTLIRLTPVVEELALERHGLDYIDLDPLFFAPFPDGDAVFFHRDVERTCAGLDRAFPGQGGAYRDFLDTWRPFARLVRDAFLDTPSPWKLGRRFAFNRAFRDDWKRALAAIASPYGQVAAAAFSEEKVRTPLVWMAAQSGPPPTEPLSAPFLLWQPLYHEGGIARPRGGSGRLSEALADAVRDAGGEIHVDAPVEEILVEGGRAVGVRVGGHVHSARAVLSGAHVLETLGRLLPPEHRPEGLDRLRVGNGFGAVLRVALDRPVRYAAHPGREARVALQLLCRDTFQIDAAYGDFLRRRPPSDPPIVAMTFSAVDDSLAPPGGEVLWLWAQYYPYALAEGGWDDIAEREADRLLDAFEAYAPGTRDAVVGRLFQHPLALERELGLLRGNVMHLEMGLDQMFGLRPAPGMSGYKGPLPGLYLTGASTHPGGGIMGASGRNASRVLLEDLDRKRV
ncbi:MAG: NAD(P)/FAD-dependent oxidoreductase, partial [Rhodothermales bacterium]|nr:NAD(P)/FAD-dependent oxidoreductase [Rhodothermales bacterium]